MNSLAQPGDISDNPLGHIGIERPACIALPASRMAACGTVPPMCRTDSSAMRVQLDQPAGEGARAAVSSAPVG